MARKAIDQKLNEVKSSASEDDFTSDLIKSLNKEHGSRIAYNLAVDTSPTHVKRWISTGSKQMDLIISNPHRDPDRSLDAALGRHRGVHRH